MKCPNCKEDVLNYDGVMIHQSNPCSNGDGVEIEIVDGELQKMFKNSLINDTTEQQSLKRKSLIKWMGERLKWK